MIASGAFRAGVVCAKLVQTQPSIRLPVEGPAQVGDWTRVHHNPLQA